jgi:hypothetical protein
MSPLTWPTFFFRLHIFSLSICKCVYVTSLKSSLRFQECLIQYHNKCKRFPDKVLVFRSGASFGETPMLRDTEIDKMKEKFEVRCPSLLSKIRNLTRLNPRYLSERTSDSLSAVTCIDNWIVMQ